MFAIPDNTDRSNDNIQLFGQYWIKQQFALPKVSFKIFHYHLKHWFTVLG